VLRNGMRPADAQICKARSTRRVRLKYVLAVVFWATASFCLGTLKESGSAADPVDGAGQVPTAQPAVNQQSADAEAVKRAQAKLQSEGFYSGPMDGLMTEATKGALRRFQMRSGLEQTGILDPGTLRLLDPEKNESGDPKVSESNAGATSRGTDSAPVAGALDVVPKSFPAERYREMLEQSPFALATPAAANAEPEPNFAMNLFVKAIAKLRYPDGRQSEYVTIQSRADNTTFSLEGNQPNKDGISLVGVEWQDGFKSKVSLKKGTEVGTLEFDEANIRGASAAGASGAVGAGGAVNAQAGGVPPFPGGGSQRPANRPAGSGLIAQPLNGAGRPATPVAGKTGGLSTPGSTSVRQRIRPISSGQGMLKPPQPSSR
jgi:peptidoglycan hydrolase-like protein with peptidoglycan-binding domain